MNISMWWKEMKKLKRQKLLKYNAISYETLHNSCKWLENLQYVLNYHLQKNLQKCVDCKCHFCPIYIVDL